MIRFTLVYPNLEKDALILRVDDGFDSIIKSTERVVAYARITPIFAEDDEGFKKPAFQVSISPTDAATAEARTLVDRFVKRVFEVDGSWL